MRQELINRGVTDFPKWAPKATLAQMLEDIIIEEEKREVLCGLVCACVCCLGVPRLLIVIKAECVRTGAAVRLSH